MCYFLSFVLAFFITTSYLTIQQNITLKSTLELAIYWTVIIGPFGQLLSLPNVTLPFSIPLYVDVILQSSLFLLVPLSGIYIFHVQKRAVSLVWLLFWYFLFVTLFYFLMFDGSMLSLVVRTVCIFSTFYFQYWIFRLAKIELPFEMTKMNVKKGLLTHEVLLVLNLVFALGLTGTLLLHLFNNSFFNTIAALHTTTIIIPVALFSRGYIKSITTGLESNRSSYNTAK
ncbi:hypothetical protein N478_06385 [Pseudoalteromonas luteoviolacea S4060-1]|uniref:Uncharacterized protein n=1 Tax=Pseudoalteromonas luteoviolacea S4060-1 TaxID=1365257 RepID=A0A162AM00_9GAMM|nr:hypothetical protein N478_06385 [Pseudoalteromonas luteoviolacea S4060-1]